MSERPDQRAVGARGVAGELADAVLTRRPERRPVTGDRSLARSGSFGGMADADGRQRDRLAGREGCEPDGQAPGRIEGDGLAQRRGEDGGVDNTVGNRRRAGGDDHAEYERIVPDATLDTCGLGDAARERCGEARPDGAGHSQRIADAGPALRPGPTNGFWRNADWLICRDDKWRPIEPGTFPLVDGASARVGRLRAYGNAICIPAAQAFIEAYLDSRCHAVTSHVTIAA